MTTLRFVLIAIGLTLGCSKQAPSSDTPRSDAPRSNASRATGGASSAGDGDIESWILTRLRRPGRALDEIEAKLSKDVQDRHAIRAVRGFGVADPPMQLYVARFDDHAKASAADEALLDTLENGEPPLYYAKSATTGAYLLIVGFPSDKPASPEMESAQTQYLSAFAGEE